MIRKMLVVAAAVAMPATAVAGVTAVAGSGIAGAAKAAPVAVTCSLSGTVTFSKPGLSATGSVTSKATEFTKTAITPTGAAACSNKAIKSKITAATTECWATAPTYTSKTSYTGGTLASGAASACDVGHGAATGDTLNAKSIKTAVKDHLYYDTAGSLVSGPADILTALSAGVKTKDNGNNIVLMPTHATTIVPGGTACGGSEAGFGITGNVTGGGSAVTTFSMNICLGTDSGTGTTGSFFADLVGGTGTIAVANVDPATSSVALS